MLRPVIYAIGDLHGCLYSLQRLLREIDWRRGIDQLWFVGDLVNRGPHSFATLRFVAELPSATVVLGNHDLRLISMVLSQIAADPRGPLEELLHAPDRIQWIDWLRHRPVLHREAGWTMVHAGLLPHWSPAQTDQRARAIEHELRGANALRLIEAARAPLDAEELAATLAVFTRVRVCDQRGLPVWGFDGSPAERPPGTEPWFAADAPNWNNEPIVFGHWARLGVHCGSRVYCIDGGCARGGSLVALRLDDRRLFQVDRDPADAPLGDPIQAR
jgi:bis(5'-nucleosyl)-tetraphosphatase (symmetrical)